VIDGEGEEARPLLTMWGEEWAKVIGEAVAEGRALGGYDTGIIGQAIVGALYQTGREAQYAGRSREALVANLTAFLTRALRPD
jgi:hypothetical protein